MYTGALENHPELVDQMAWIAPLLGNPGEVLARVRSPWELSKALNMAGFLFPEMCTTSASLPIDKPEVLVAKINELTAAAHQALLDGTVGARSASGPRLTPLDTLIRQKAKVEVAAKLASIGAKFPKKDETITFGGETFTKKASTTAADDSSSARRAISRG